MAVPARGTAFNRTVTGSGDAQDLTARYDYQRLIDEEIDEYCNIEVTEDLREGGVHALKAWDYWFIYLARNVWKTDFAREVVDYASRLSNPRILSLGCGYGGHELNIARLLTPPFELVGVDLNPHIFSQAQDEAREASLNIRFDAGDLNFLQIDRDCFDIIYAHASLHHVINLEKLMLQIRGGLKKGGRLIVVDMIGRNRSLFWKENRDFAKDVIREMPSRYKSFMHILDRLRWGFDVDHGMEGVRQEEIEPEILKYFTPVKCFKYGSFMRMICANKHIGANINPDKDEDRRYLESLFRLDLEQIELGRLRPTEMFAVFRHTAIQGDPAGPGVGWT